MIINDINKPMNSKTLNETLAKRFGTKIDVDSFTLEQLQDARNKIRTKLSQIETNESFSGLSENETYSKNKLFLDVLNAAISERADVDEGKDQDEDGDKDFADVQIARMVKSGMSKAAAIKKVKDKDYNESDDRRARAGKSRGTKKMDEGKEIIGNYFRSLLEGAEDQAELVMAAKDMVDRLTGWMEDTAEMQSESMLELADAIRDEMGSQQSEEFTNTVKPALESLYAAMEATRISLTQGVGQLTGEAEPMDAIGDIPADVEPEEPAMEPTLDGDAVEDEFAAAAPAAGGEEEAGRAKRESRRYKTSAMLEQSRRLGTLLSSRS